MLVNRHLLTRSVYDNLKDNQLICPHCGGDIEVEEELAPDGELGQCVVCLKWAKFTAQKTRKLMQDMH